MRKLLFSTAIVFACLTAQAQIEDGSVAPDFTVTDLAGNTHTLSTYLAQGKTVIIDISATWCGPCWNYHESGALGDLYYTYGPAGSDEVVVLFVEGDGHTSIESLYGTNMPGDSGVTAGNWMEHSPYPVIDNSQLSDLYQINYYPTIFRICPDGLVSEINQLDFAGLKDNINANCDALTDLQYHAKSEIEDITICEGSAVTPQVGITNYGTDPINTATIELRQGETVLATKNYTGALAMFDDTVVTFDALEIPVGDDYQAIITNINGAAPGNTQTATDLFTVAETNVGNNNIQVKVYTNFYPNDMSWAIKNSVGTVVASGGPYLPGNEDMFHGGGPDANTTKVHDVVLPGTDTECYAVEFYSSSDLGWIGGDTPHGIEIVSAGETIFEQFVKNFGSVLNVPSAFKTNGTLDILTQDTSKFTLFPNPTTGILNFSTSGEAVTLTVFDMTGKLVYTADTIQNGESINLSLLHKGIYIAKIKTENTQRTEKIIVR
jgi:hypothetical protein